MKVMGIIGKKFNGKDTLAQMMLECFKDDFRYTPVLVAFGDAVKQELTEQYNVNPYVFYDPELKEVFNEQLGTTPRKLMQYHGTEFRRAQDPDYWVKALDKNVKKLLARRGTELVVIATDLRFPNEVKWILSNDGKVIGVTRNLESNADQHKSESQIEGLMKEHAFTIYDNGGTIEDLKKQVVQDFAQGFYT